MKEHKVEEIALETSVTVSTVNRWIHGQSKPQPKQESILRKLYSKFIQNNNSIDNAVDKCLTSLREVFHKTSRFSSRNEALEEISKLFFAHIMSEMQNGIGISQQMLNSKENAALCLVQFVNYQFERFRKNGIAFDISFDLKIKPSENKLASEIISVFDEMFSDICFFNQLKGRDILNEVFGKFLADSFVDEKQLGQYLTPQEIVSFSNELLFCDIDLDCVIDKEFGYILDPSCGVGSFLASFIDKVYSLKHVDTDISEIIHNLITNKIIGIDKSERMLKLALINLSMFGCQDIRLYLKNALDFNDICMDSNVSIIMTNPPFGAEFPKKEIENFNIVSYWSEKRPNKVNSEILFLEKYIDWLKPGGLLICIVPDSILNNKGIYESLRIGISRKISIKAVISLPSNTFATTGTETKTSLFYLEKSPYNSANKTYMAICRNNGYDVITIGNHKTKRYNNSSDLNNILNDYISKSDIFGQWVTGLNEHQRWDAAYFASIPNKMQKELQKSNFLKIKDVAYLANERFNPKRYEPDKFFDYIEISDVDTKQMRAYGKKVLCSDAPSRARKIVRSNDIVFSTVRPERGVVAVISSEQDNFVCTTGFAVLRTNTLEPLVLSYLLQSEFVATQIKKYAMGISYPVIDEKDLLEINIPISKNEIEQYSKVAEELKQKEQELINLREEFKNFIQTKLITV